MLFEKSTDLEDTVVKLDRAENLRLHLHLLHAFQCLMR